MAIYSSVGGVSKNLTQFYTGKDGVSKELIVLDTLVGGVTKELIKTPDYKLIAQLYYDLGIVNSGGSLFRSSYGTTRYSNGKLTVPSPIYVTKLDELNGKASFVRDKNNLTVKVYKNYGINIIGEVYAVLKDGRGVLLRSIISDVPSSEKKVRWTQKLSKENALSGGVLSNNVKFSGVNTVTTALNTELITNTEIGTFNTWDSMSFFVFNTDGVLKITDLYISIYNMDFPVYFRSNFQ